MKSIFLYFNLFLMFFIAGTTTQSFAEKKYRYIKREHGANFVGNINGPIAGTGRSIDANIMGSFKGSYSYNWKGIVEVGPYFGLDLGIVPFSFSGWKAGVKGEYNFIKNRGRRKLIPSLGLSIGASNSLGNALSFGLYGSLKAFVARRTAFVTNLGYALDTPFSAMFREMSHGLDVNMGFSYYFDFY